MAKNTNKTEIQEQMNQLTVIMRRAWNDPAWGIKTIYGEDVTPQQVQMCEAFRDHRRVVIASANGQGKSHIASRMFPFYLLSRYPAYVVLTSSSFDTMMETLMPHIKSTVALIRENLNVGHFIQPCMETQWWPLGKEDRVGAYALITESPKRPENIAGRHNRNVWVFSDESSALEPSVMEAIDAITVAAQHKITLAGNPLCDSGPYFAAYNENFASEDNPHGWHRIHLDAYESPNIVSGEILFPNMPGPLWIEERKREWGEESWQFQARVRGNFPDTLDDTLISRKMILDACARDATPRGGIRELGADIAHSETGDDSVFTVIEDRKRIIHREAHKGLSAPDSARLIEQLMIDWNVRDTRIDATGNPGVYHTLKDKGVPGVHGVVSSQRAHDASNFNNIRAEMFHRFATALKTDLAIPPRWKQHYLKEAGLKKRIKNGMWVERKDEYKKRVGRSPDNLDSAALVFADEIGVPVYESADTSVHLMQVKPEITAVSGSRYTCALSGLPGTAREGLLLRGIHVGGNNPSGAVWCHLDENGVWTVYNALSTTRVGDSVHFIRDVADASGDEIYTIDIMTSDDADRFAGDVLSFLYECAPRAKSFPTFVPKSEISGKRGTDAIDRLLIGTLARLPDHAYWQDHRHRKPDDKSPMIIFHPKQVLREIEDAKFDEPHKTTLETATRPEKLREGPLLHALRAVIVNATMMDMAA